MNPALCQRIAAQTRHTGIPAPSLRMLCMRAGLEALERGELTIRANVSTADTEAKPRALQDVSRYTGVSVKALRKLGNKIGEQRVASMFGPPQKSNSIEGRAKR